ncbi:hypothetical protein BUTYVIB_00613 [Eshraghiella crossota DSM 2876]|uniref:Uncharacterized protein n=1 Tax=Eshraghiella crossota DSM 2876 TaxID=511680 RepID=D4RXR2_9FIRM|nr:hypothetical protein BUTYVIB_00613 [Butyrivibrio crossotus DSM 2876]
MKILVKDDLGMIHLRKFEISIMNIVVNRTKKLMSHVQNSFISAYITNPKTNSMEVQEKWELLM